MKNLFGEDVPPAPTRKGGYAAAPGSGPKGETCGSCGHRYRHEYNLRGYYKCQMCRGDWTSGTGTDIRLKSAACLFWIKQIEPGSPAENKSGGLL